MSCSDKDLWWISKAQIQISGSKDEAKEQHNHRTEKASGELSICTDGFGIDKKISVAACDRTLDGTRVQHLGDENSFNVFAAELTAMNLALTMA